MKQWAKWNLFPYSAYVICHSYKVLCGNDLCLPVHRLSAYYLSPAHHHYAPITLDSFLLSKHSRLSATLSLSLVFLSIYNVFLSHFQSLLKCQLLRRSSLILHYHSILFFSVHLCQLYKFSIAAITNYPKHSMGKILLPSSFRLLAEFTSWRL